MKYKKTALVFILFVILQTSAFTQQYKIIDTGQEDCYDTLIVINCPEQGEAYYGQDSQFDGIQFSFQDNSDGTITDLNTGLIWQQFLFEDKYSYEDVIAVADSFSLNGFTDWRLPSIKELYSLIDFRGATGVSAAQSVPFIDTTYFEFRYGDETSGERFIDAQYVSSTEYVGTTMNGDFTVFGVNFADGRIKGYGTTSPMGGDKLFEVRLVRGSSNYGINLFSDNNDGTISDDATGLMWSKDDNGTGLNWKEALDWVYQKNQENYLITAIVHCADVIVNALSYGNSGSSVISAISEDVWNSLKLDSSSLSKLLPKINEEVDKATNLLSL